MVYLKLIIVNDEDTAVHSSLAVLLNESTQALETTSLRKLCFRMKTNKRQILNKVNSLDLANSKLYHPAIKKSENR